MYKHLQPGSYYKNGAKISPDLSSVSEIIDLATYEQKVFAIGYYLDSATRASRACAIVDSVVIPLVTHVEALSTPLHIDVIDGDWYVAGVVDYSHLVVWKNGVESARIFPSAEKVSYRTPSASLQCRDISSPRTVTRCVSKEPGSPWTVTRKPPLRTLPTRIFLAMGEMPFPGLRVTPRATLAWLYRFPQW